MDNNDDDFDGGYASDAADAAAEYAEELFLDRKAKEGWTYCKECSTWLHTEDYHNGVGCNCVEECWANPQEERVFDNTHPNGAMTL